MPHNSDKDPLYEVLRAYRNSHFNAFDHYYSNDQLKLMVDARPLTEDQFLSLCPDKEDQPQFECYGSKFLELINIFSQADEDDADGATRARQLLHQIETDLHADVISILRLHYNDQWWYAGIPETVRVKAAQMHEVGAGKVRKEDLLVLMSLMQTITSNWSLFQEKYDPESKGKRQFERDFRSLNDIRNRLSHPIRLRREPLRTTDLREIEKWMNLCSGGS